MCEKEIFFFLNFICVCILVLLVAHLLTGNNETLYPIYNSGVGQNSSASTAGLIAGNYNPSEPAINIFDQNLSTKYLNYGTCNAVTTAANCGLQSGFYFTAARGLSLLKSFRFGTGNDYPERDPFTITIEGSNATILTLGSSWTLIYNGSTGLESDPGRSTFGVTQNLSNTIWCRSYRVLATSKRAASSSVQYSEMELYGY